MKIELTSKDAVWNQTGEGVCTAIVDRNREQWQVLVNVRVSKEGALLNEYMVAIDQRGRVTLEKRDKPIFFK